MHGSDSQRPFAIVIVGGLLSDLVMSIFLLPTLYVWMAGRNDILPKAEVEFDESLYGGQFCLQPPFQAALRTVYS